MTATVAPQPDDIESEHQVERLTRRSWIETMGLSLVAAGVTAALIPGDAPSASHQPQASSPRQLLQQRHLPNLPLVTQQGDRVRFYDDLVKDKKIVINFFDPSLATSDTVIRNLAATHQLLGRRMGRDIHMYTVTLHPETDTPAVLRARAAQYSDQTGWTHLTGEPPDVEKLRNAIGFAYPDPTDDTNPSNIISILRYGVEPEMRWAHTTTLGNPKMLAHMILADFGPDPADPTARFDFYCKLLAPTA